jgi:large subunit ribosomal protein L13e
LRRKDTSNETLTANTNRLKTYLSKIILHPRKQGKNAKKSTVPEATAEVLAGPNAKSQNTTKEIIPLPKPEAGFTWTSLTKEVKEASAYKTLRTEWKTATGYYKRLEAWKKKANKK